MGVRPLSAPWSPWLQARRSLLIFRSVGIAALPYQSIIPPHILQSFSWPARWQIPRHSPPIRDGGTNDLATGTLFAALAAAQPQPKPGEDVAPATGRLDRHTPVRENARELLQRRFW